jgi:hypothetical protein
VKYFEELFIYVFGSKNDSAAACGISLIRSDERNLYNIVPEKSKIEGILSTDLILRMGVAEVAIARFQWQQTSAHVSAG